MRIISGEFKNRLIVSPKGLNTRPTSSKLRESLFNICQHTIQGAKVLDLFAGSGALGLEAISRGAEFATFVDSSKESVRSIKKNLDHLNVQSKAQILLGDVFNCLDRLEKKQDAFDIIFADPPYNQEMNWDGENIRIADALLKFFEKSSLLVPGGMFFVEEGKESAKEIKPSSVLSLVSSRRMGRSVLLQYEKR